MSVDRIKIKIFYLLGIFGICFAIFSLCYNLFKSVSEVRNWVPLAENQKREKLFGDVHLFSQFIIDNTDPHAEIVFFSKDGMNYYYNRYYLYPRRITWFTSDDSVHQSIAEKSYSYIASYDHEFSFVDYHQIASFSSQMTDTAGVLYKKNE